MDLTDDDDAKTGHVSDCAHALEKPEDVRLTPTRPLKRSFSISGHRTSISLETAFWEALRHIAASEGRSLASIVAKIDRERGDAGLSGAVRVYVLDYYRELASLK